MADEVEVTPKESTPPVGNQGERVFTQAELNAAIAERLSRENIKELKAKAAELDQLKQSQMTEVEKAKSEAARLAQELAAKNQALAEIEIRLKKENLLEAAGLPRSWSKRIIGNTDEEIQADIAALKAELGGGGTAPVSGGSNPITEQQQIKRGVKPSLNDLLHKAING